MLINLRPYKYSFIKRWTPKLLRGCYGPKLPYYRMLWFRTKTLYQKGKIDSFYVSNGNIKIRLQENARPITISHTHDFIKYFPGVDLSE